MEDDSSTGYWGPVTATIDWCETNYQVSHYIAEFWNTSSNIIFVGLALLGLRRSIKFGFDWKYHVYFTMVAIVGTGSALYHGTLRHMEQQLDETPMVIGVLSWFYALFETRWSDNKVLRVFIPCFLIFYGAFFAYLHSIYRWTTFFQVHFVILALVCGWRVNYLYRHTTSPAARLLGERYATYSLIGGLFWLVDYHLCNHVKMLPLNFQGHAWWHVFMGLSAYHGPLFLQHVRAEQLGLNPTVTFELAGILPTVVMKRKDSHGDLKSFGAKNGI